MSHGQTVRFIWGNELAAGASICPAVFNAQQQRAIEWPARPVGCDLYHWDLGHLLERIRVDTRVAPDRSQVSWSNSRLQPGETRRLVAIVPARPWSSTPSTGDGRVPVGHADRHPERH